MCREPWQWEVSVLSGPPVVVTGTYNSEPLNTTTANFLEELLSIIYNLLHTTLVKACNLLLQTSP